MIYHILYCVVVSDSPQSSQGGVQVTMVEIVPQNKVQQMKTEESGTDCKPVSTLTLIIYISVTLTVNL